MLLFQSFFSRCRFVVSGSDDIVVDNKYDDVDIDDDAGVSVGVSSVIDGGDPHRKRVFSVLPVARGSIGGVTIFAAAVVVDVAALQSLSLLLSLSLSFSSFFTTVVIRSRGVDGVIVTKDNDDSCWTTTMMIMLFCAIIVGGVNICRWQQPSPHEAFFDFN